MTHMVPFDGSALSEAALAKARLYAIALDESSPDLKEALRPPGPQDVTAVSVIPDSARYAREMDWITDDEEFSARRMIDKLQNQVADIDPNASFQSIRVDGFAGAGTISKRLRQMAGELDARVVFIGSENAGRIVTPLTSVAAPVAADQRYDVHIVRRRLPP